MKSRAATLAAGALLATLIILAFLPTLSQGWAPLDDGLNFTRNPHFRGLAWENLRWMWSTRHAGHFIPLTWMTLGADFRLSGMDPAGYHRTNLLLHLANALLCFGLALRLFHRPDRPDAGGAGLPGSVMPPILAAFAAAGFFALHPLRVESVAWITERRDLLCGCFCLIAAHAWVTCSRAAGAPRRRAYALALAAFAGALLSKGIAIALPVALLALDAGPLQRLGPDPRRWKSGPWRTVLLEKLPFFALSAIFAWVALWAAADVLRTSAAAGLEYRLLAAGFGLSFYLEKTFLPIAIPFQIPATTLLSVKANPEVAARALGFLLLGGMAILVAWRRRHPQPAPALALAVFAAFALPVSGLLQAGPQLAAHRYTYLACLPFALLVGGVVLQIERGGKGRVRVATAAVVLAGAVLLAAAARKQVALWQDAITFCRAAVRDAPLAWAPVGRLAQAHLERGEESQALATLQAGRLRFPSAMLLPYMEALVRATSSSIDVRDGAEALRLAQQLVAYTSSQDPAALLALAAAVAENGDGEAALRLLDAAAALAQSGRKPDLLPAVEEFRRRVLRRGVVRMTSDDWRGLFS